jgi:EAL domain-containing protein (putative c-di-GMP-specific phosphodiesterase class I)
MVDAELALHMLHRLFALGVRIAIDDYGTGSASLSYLKRLPADELKIDQAFVQHLTMDQADQAIVRSTVNLAHSLGIRVVAEGVEDLATWNLLSALGCDIAQGYYLSRPIPPPELVCWLDARQEEDAHQPEKRKDAVAL